MKNTSLFCRLPWHSISLSPSGGIGPCCIIPDYAGNYKTGETLESAWNGKKIRGFRKTLISGKINERCQSCKKKDDQGIPSLRSIYEDVLRQEINDNVDYNKSSFGHLSDIHRLDISFSNRCNLKCRFCYTGNSTQWFADRDKLTNINANFFSKILGVTNEVFDIDIDALVVFIEKCQNLREIEIKGGEPMLFKSHKRFLRKIIDCGLSKKIKLLYTINGTLFDSEYLELWTHFRRTSMTVSIDGLGGIYQYVRGGKISFEKDVIPNLKLIKTASHIDLSIHYTLCGYNLVALPQFVEWLDDSEFSEIHLSLGIVNSPPFLNPDILPQSITKKVKEQLIDCKRNEIIGFVENFQSLESRLLDSLRLDFFYYTKNLDHIRKTNFVDVCPQLKSFYDSLQKRYAYRS